MEFNVYFLFNVWWTAKRGKLEYDKHLFTLSFPTPMTWAKRRKSPGPQTGTNRTLWVREKLHWKDAMKPVVIHLSLSPLQYRAYMFDCIAVVWILLTLQTRLLKFCLPRSWFQEESLLEVIRSWGWSSSEEESGLTQQLQEALQRWLSG